MLEAFFLINIEREKDGEEEILYEEVIEDYKFEKGAWIKRKYDREPGVARLQNVSVKRIELFCLRQLLRYKKGPKSFK